MRRIEQALGTVWGWGAVSFSVDGWQRGEES